MVSLLFLALPLRSAQAQDCPSIGASITAINAALDEALLDEALAEAQAGEEALRCQAQPVSTLLLTTLLQLKGTVHLFRGENREAERAFEWAVAVAPTGSLDKELGVKSSNLYDEVRERVLATPMGSLEIQDDVAIWIDGREVPSGSPIELPAGPHLVQWQPHLGELKTLQLTLTPGESRTLTLTAVKVSASGKEKGQTTRALAGWWSGNRRTVLLRGGSAAAGTGVAFLALSVVRYNEFNGDNTSGKDDLTDMANGVNRATQIGATLGIAGAAALGLALVPSTDGTTVVLQGAF